MSDENDKTTTSEPEDLLEEGNIVEPENAIDRAMKAVDKAIGIASEMAESDPAIDMIVLVSQRDQAQKMARDLERQVQQKQYELDLNGGLARLNIAGDILTGYAAAGNLPALAGESRLQAAMRYADEIVTDFELKMEKRAAEFMKMVAMSPSDEINPAGREN